MLSPQLLVARTEARLELVREVSVSELVSVVCLEPEGASPPRAACAHRACADRDRTARVMRSACRLLFLVVAILAEDDVEGSGLLIEGLGGLTAGMLDQVFVLGDPPDYEPTPDRSIVGLAERNGVCATARSPL